MVLCQRARQIVAHPRHQIVRFCSFFLGAVRLGFDEGGFLVAEVWVFQPDRSVRCLASEEAASLARMISLACVPLGRFCLRDAPGNPLPHHT